jgi:hypothetical protein
MHVANAQVIRENKNNIRLRSSVQAECYQPDQCKLESHGSGHHTGLAEQAKPVGVILIPR